MFSMLERHELKKNDKMRDVERERERKSETKTPIQTTIQHLSHPHPLIYLESDDDDTTFSCNSCAKTGRGKTYHCNQCNNFYLHVTCALTPLTHLLSHQELETNGAHLHREVITTFSHRRPQHELVSEYKTQKFDCSVCYGSGNGLRFNCVIDTCKSFQDQFNIGYHPVCVKNPTRLTSYLHPDHELELRLSPRSKICDLCGTKGRKNNSMYTCTVCDFYIHPVCTQWPLYLIHPLHPPHPLMFKPCGDPGDGYMYSCWLCEVGFSLDYVWQQSTLGEGDGDEQVRTKYVGQDIILLPAINLIPPDPSKKVSHGHPSLELAMVVISGVADVLSAFSV